ncbi:MAG: UDP-3-O-(3-hydroxymyristoyl)glucosamine N-acyltransferase [Gemmatimonadaceae bacterium]|jgi:UDP-3-O-[3-hydroxymyristoyl] glucosamine N-acyltransferase|nr:UDP-3-O-(3-hydroxymyristoyl)glucosamine N-acyltransferase [Gemmatimonadaceae bacterium]
MHGDTGRGAGLDEALTATRVAQAVRGRLEGDGTRVIARVAPLARATPDAISFLTSARYAESAAATQAGVVLVPEALAAHVAHVAARIVVPAPHDAMLQVLPLLHRPARMSPGVHPTAVLGRGVVLGDDVHVGPYVVVGEGARVGARAVLHGQNWIGAGVELDDDCVLWPGVRCYPGTHLGRRVTVHANTVLGSDGFGYVQRQGVHVKIPHVGRCVIEDDVEIGAGCTIDRGSIDDTVIGAGAKLDNLVQLGHNVKLGRLSLVMAQVGVAGSTTIGDGVILAGQAGLAGHIEIGSGARIAAQAGVIGSVPAGETWSGYPARPHRESLRASAALQKLPALLRTLGKTAAGDA